MHYFAQPVITLIGLGIAIDYGLFVVSRFREEIAEGQDTETAVRHAVTTAGRTVTFSSVLIVLSAAGLVAVPAGLYEIPHLRDDRLGHVVGDPVDHRAACLPGDAGPQRRLPWLCTRSCGCRSSATGNPPTGSCTGWASESQKTKTLEEVENGFWGRLANRVMKRPILFATPIVIIMILLIVPLGNLSLGGISEKYLPPNNSVRQAQEEFDRIFPGFRTEPLTLVIQSSDHRPVTDNQVAQIRSEAMTIPGFIDPDNHPANMWKERPYLDGASKDPSVRVIQNGLVNRNEAATKIDAVTVDVAAARTDRVGRRHTRARTRQHPEHL